MLDDLWAWHPPIGVWIGILGLLGVLVPLIREKIGKREKAVWTVVMFVLLGLELKTVYQDRNEHDKEQADARGKEERNFKDIAGGITNSIELSDRNFNATMNQMRSLLESEEATRRNTQPKAQLKLDGLEATNDPKQWNVLYSNVGNEDALDTKMGATMYLGRPDLGRPEDAADLTQMVKKFEKWWTNPTTRHFVGQSTPKGEHNQLFSFDILPPTDITADQMQQLEKKTLTKYVFVRLVYSDHSGRWVNDACIWALEPLKLPNPAIPWKFCKSSNGPRYQEKTTQP